MTGAEPAAGAMTGEALLSVTGLGVASRIGGRRRLIVEDVCLEVGPGEAIAIVGESGSGKSMTARALMGLLPDGVAATGSIRLGGDELVGASERTWRTVRGRRLALMPQDPFTMLSPLRRAADHIRDGAPGPFDDAEVARRLAEAGVPDPAVARRLPFQLSGGLRQRVGIAAALAADPDILIADEPTTALDVTSQRTVLELLARLRAARGLALVLITHDLRVAFAVCDRVHVMYAGRLLEVGPTARVEHAPSHPYTYGLLRSEPTVDTRFARLEGIAGSVPRPEEVAGQCAFAPRCAWRAPQCVAERPVLAPHGTGAATACVRVAIPARPAHRAGVSVEPTSIAAELRIADRPVAGRATVEPGSPVLRVNGVRRIFPGRRGGAPVSALRGVDLTVATGEIVGIVGESGSGKTTLARVVAGLERADDGEVTLPGTPPPGRREPYPVQIVFQDPSATLNPARRVGAILADALRAAGLPRGRADVAKLLAEVALPEEYALRRPVALSGGERQRVAIARAIATGPRLLIADEPVSALDVSVQAQILELFRDLRDRLDLGVLFITHDLGVVRQVADRLYVLRAGEVVEEGDADQVLGAPRHEYTRELLAAIPRGSADRLAAPPAAREIGTATEIGTAAELGSPDAGPAGTAAPGETAEAPGTAGS